MTMDFFRKLSKYILSISLQHSSRLHQFMYFVSGSLYSIHVQLFRCCYITVDFATAASSQNGSSTFKHFVHKECHILFRKCQKHIRFFYHFHLLSQSSRETSLLLYMTHLLWYAITSFCDAALQNPALCSSFVIYHAVKEFFIVCVNSV